MIQRILVVLIIGVLASCSSTKTIAPAAQAALDEAIQTKQFTVKLEWAYPLDVTSAQVLNSLQPAGGIVNGNRVYLDNASYTLKVANDSITAFMPYFGTRQISGGLSGNTGIQIEQEVSDWKVLPTKKSGQQDVRIGAREKGEAYDIAIKLFAKGTAVVVLSSTQRQSIRYTGRWE